MEINVAPVVAKYIDTINTSLNLNSVRACNPTLLDPESAPSVANAAPIDAQENAESLDNRF